MCMHARKNHRCACRRDNHSHVQAPPHTSPLIYALSAPRSLRLRKPVHGKANTWADPALAPGMIPNNTNRDVPQQTIVDPD